MQLFKAEGDEAYVGAILLADALRTIRDWDAANRKK
jgi:hypothetical protein